MPKEKNRCRGSFRLGTACANCDRCTEKGYTETKQKEAQDAYKEKLKTLPADRVKPRNQVTIKNPEVIKE